MLSHAYYTKYIQFEKQNGIRNRNSCCSYCGYMARPSSAAAACDCCTIKYKKAGHAAPLKFTLQ